jgi:5-methylcytosine-specific restriction endonuclease McrA
MFDFFKKNIRYASRSSKWSSVRKDFLKKNPKCSACGKTNDIEVHHIVPVHINPELELNQENLIALCGKNCHIIFGHLMDFRSWNKDVIEDCKVYYNKVQNKPK